MDLKELAKSLETKDYTLTGANVANILACIQVALKSGNIDIDAIHELNDIMTKLGIGK